MFLVFVLFVFVQEIPCGALAALVRDAKISKDGLSLETVNRWDQVLLLEKEGDKRQWQDHLC